jgi:2-desacetyl-2-hydroxyethyl bacteriochlorophyllide A dehydrogenase
MPAVETARAIWFSAPRKVEIRSAHIEPPGPGEVLVETLASAISHGTEMLVFRGQVPLETTLDLPTLEGSFRFPIKYGYAAVGRVAGLGPGVDGLAMGDPVFALHPHQTGFVVPATLLARLPSTLSPERGLFFANVETALNALLDEPVRLGERIVVLGQGVVGLLIGMLARRSGARRVIGADASERRRGTARALGADEALSIEDGLSDRIRRAVGKGEADLVFEASGNPSALQTAIDVVAPHGTVVVCSWYGTKAASLKLGGHFHRGRVRIRSTQVGQVDPALSPRWDRERRGEEVLALLAELPLERLISHRFAFQDAAEAYRLVDERTDETVQVMLTYGNSSRV